jgi:hypothetical protein
MQDSKWQSLKDNFDNPVSLLTKESLYVEFLMGIKKGIDQKDQFNNWPSNHDKKGRQTNDQSQCVLSE